MVTIRGNFIHRAVVCRQLAFRASKHSSSVRRSVAPATKPKVSQTSASHASEAPCHLKCLTGLDCAIACLRHPAAPIDSTVSLDARRQSAMLAVYSRRLSPFYLIALFFWMCLLFQTSPCRGNHLKDDLTPESNCFENGSLCPEAFNQSCNLSTGRCTCPLEEPILLSSDIPCLKGKLLGQVCLHSLECSTVPNAACFATILFPLELQSVPTYRQWYIYQQITESGELNYLLNKVYGQCRCKAGYRAIASNRCLSKSANTKRACHNSTDCTLSRSSCNEQHGECFCGPGFVYDSEQGSCSQLGEAYGQFCVISTDCQAIDPNLQCIKSRCACAQSLPRPANQTTCPFPPKECPPGQIWNQEASLCEERASSMLNSLLVKVVLLILLKLIICNLLRMACYSKRIAAAQQDLRGIHPGSRFFESSRQNGQSRSLLSLPPYEVIISEPIDGARQPEDCLPTYEEALQSMASNGDYKTVNTSQE